MVTVTVRCDEQQRVSNLTVDGHAEFSDSEHGGDIVCSAVSALVGYLGIAFQEIYPDRAIASAADGHFQLSVQKFDPVVEVLLNTWVHSVQQLEENYQGWVKVVRQI